MSEHPQRPGAPADDAAAVVRSVRTRLLQGRGPGASPKEVDEHTRARVRLGRRPTAERLEAKAQQTARARGDVTALAEYTAVGAERVASTLAELPTTTRPGPAPDTARVALTAAAVGVLLGWYLRSRLPHEHRRRPPTP
jgi:hypothetical protein